MSLERFQLNREYRPVAGRITAPGPFQGQPIFTPYFWRQLEAGLADDDQSFDTAQDERLFPELRGVRRITLVKDGGSVLARVE